MGLFSKLFRLNARMITPAQALVCISNRPMLMHPGALDALFASAQAMPERGASMDDGYEPHGSRPEHLIEVRDGVGVLTIEGPLFARYGIEAWWFGGTGYDMIGAAFDMLLADTNVSSIALRIDSPGGTVTGCFELADHIFAARGQKPVTAYAEDAAYSAAYAIASSADKIVLPRSGGLGSVGVRSQHVDISRALDRIGYTVTTIVSGDKKADWDSTKPLSESAHASMQAEVNRLADIFIDTVARNRGIEADAVRALQAGCLFGPGAIAAGLGDAIGTIESAWMPPSKEDDEEEEGAVGPEASAETPPDDTEMHALLTSRGFDISDNRATNVMNANLASAMPAKAAPAPSPAEPININAAVLAADLSPALTVALLKSSKPVTPETIDARITEAKAIADICAAAKLDVAADYVARGVDLETARAQLISAVAESGPELNTSHPKQEPGAGVGKTKSQTIYDRRAVAAAGRNS